MHAYKCKCEEKKHLQYPTGTEGVLCTPHFLILMTSSEICLVATQQGNTNRSGQIAFWLKDLHLPLVLNYTLQPVRINEWVIELFSSFFETKSINIPCVIPAC
jgi:hypothetical protein